MSNQKLIDELSKLSPEQLMERLKALGPKVNRKQKRAMNRQQIKIDKQKEAKASKTVPQKKPPLIKSAQKVEETISKTEPPIEEIVMEK